MSCTQEWINRGRSALAEQGVEMTPSEFAAEHWQAKKRIRASLERLGLPVVESCMDEAANLTVITDAIRAKGGAS
jgi:hypothetical protein